MSGADMLGPEFVEPVSSATPLSDDEVDTTMDEEKYAEMLKEMPAATVEGREEPRKMDANYESMSLKELQVLGRQKGLAVHSVKKKDLIDSLRNLETPGEPEGGDSGTQGFSVTLAEATPA